MKDEKYYCPNYCIAGMPEPGECRECGSPLEKITGDEYADDPEDEFSETMSNNDMDDDPTEMRWYDEGDEGLKITA